MDNPETAEIGVGDAGLYEKLSTDRQEFLDRARENARFTIPSLMPPEGHAPGAPLYRPNQAIGAHGVNTLTSKLVNTVLPPNAPVFRYLLTDQVVEDLAQDKTARSKLEKKLNEIERSVQDEIEGIGIRAAITQGIKQLIVSGNTLFYLPKKGNLRVYRLDQYVVQRDFSGNILRIIIKETVAIETLPEEVQQTLKVESPEFAEDKTSGSVNDKEVDVYTVFYRDNDRIRTYQSVKGIKLPKSTGSWLLTKTPIMALRWSYHHGEDYGRGYVDEYIGDISAVENVSRSIREGIAAAVKINPMVNPAGLTRAEDIAKAKNLEVLSGRAEDVTMLQFNKQADLALADQYLQSIIVRLRHAFMMAQSVQRDAERVTAEEIRVMVSDIENVLGGVYALLAQELQYPLINRIIDRMVVEKKIPDVSKIKGDDGKPAAPIKIVTGVEALGRGNDYNKLLTVAKEVIIPFREEAKAEFKMRDFFERVLVSASIDPDGLLMSEEEKASAQQKMQGDNMQKMSQQMLMDAVKGGAGPMAKVAAEQMAGQAAPPQE